MSVPVRVPSWAVLDDDETLVGADRRWRTLAKPVDRRRFPDRMTADDFAGVTRDSLLVEFWGSTVPGSGAWDSMFLGAAAAHEYRGLADAEFRQLIVEGLRARFDNDSDRCRTLTEQLLDRFHRDMPTNMMPPVRATDDRCRNVAPMPLASEIESRIHAGWIGQIAGGAFGTALEGCTGDSLAECYGPISAFVSVPTTVNDDCVYELLALDVLEREGLDATPSAFASAWSRVPFAWSAEWVALENLRSEQTRRRQPPLSGWAGNPMFDWIGAQMRAMVFGLVAPGNPRHAIELAAREASVSHAGGGIEAAIYSAALTSLAFVDAPIREVVVHAAKWVDELTDYGLVVSRSLDVARLCSTFDEAWAVLDEELAHRNWIHAEPNIAAVIIALWFGNASFTESFAILAKAGLDVDCNAGLVGTVLGVHNNGVPQQWSMPLRNTVETYLPNKRQLAISDVSEQTVRLARATAIYSSSQE
jgi:ADP-ribosylglycohydrolase